MTTVAARVLEAMHKAGSSTVFGLPGVHNLAFWRVAPGPAVPEIVKVRHEQTAVYAADGWARASGRLGSALVTTGPGAANGVAAFGEASMARSPLLLVASEVPTGVQALSLTRTLHQSPDQAGMFRALAKSTWTPRTAQQAAIAVGRAIEDALTPPFGPVYVDIPSDVLSQPCDPIRWSRPSNVGPTTEVSEAVATIESSSSVGIWAGGGAVAGGADDAIRELAEKLHAPVFSTFASRGILPPDHPCAVTLPQHEPELEELLCGLEVLVAIGSDFDGMLTKNASLRLPPVIDVNVLAGRRGFGYEDVLAVPGDALAITRAIADRVATRDGGPADGLRQLIEATWRRISRDPRTEEAARFVAAVAASAVDAVVINDMTIPGYWLCSYMAPARSRSVQYPVGWGTLGYALPAAVGAGALRERPVLAVCGDAGVLFAVAELATLKEQGLPVTVLIVDDGGYGMLRFDPTGSGVSASSMDLESPDFVGLCRAFGVETTEVDDDLSNLEARLRAGVGSGKPNAVVCRASLYPPRSTSPRWGEQG
jgi:acetolactate synthase-1/2/3 large subunit